MPLLSDFGREMHNNFVQPDGMSYFGLPRQSGPACRPLTQGVDALFQDYRGGSQGPLEFDFGGTASPLLSEDKLSYAMLSPFAPFVFQRSFKRPKGNKAVLWNE